MNKIASHRPAPRFRPRPSGFGIGWVLVVVNLLLMLSVAGLAWYLHARSVTRSVQHTETRHAIAQAAYALSIESSDVDGDGTVEAPAEDTTGSNLPAGGGNIPTSSAAPQQDSYATRLGYCSWDNGTTNSSANRLTGDNPATDSSVVFALISTGPDRVFQTSCAAARTGTAAGDDTVMDYTVAQLRKGLAGTKFFGIPVPDNATLNAVPTSSLQNGETRLVTGTNSLVRWDSAASTWDTLGGGAASATNPITGFKNQLINGDFSIWQRGTTFNYSSSTGCTNCYTADRWRVSWPTATSYSVQVQQKQANGSSSYPTGFYNYLHVAISSASSSPAFTLDQPIENVTTLAGDKATLSFYARASSTASVAASGTVIQKFGTGGSANQVSNTVTATIPGSNVWQKFTMTFSIPSITGQTLGTDSNLDLQLTLTAATSSVTMDFGMFQLETGDAATPFEYRPPGTEQALAERYYQASGTDSSDTTRADYTPASSTLDRSVRFYVPMRATPNAITLTQHSTSQWTTCAVSVYACLSSSSANGFTYTLKANGTSEIKTSDLRWTADAEFHN